MPMLGGNSRDGNIVRPAAEQPPVHPTPLPEGHEQQTPEFLNQLISELNQIRNRRSALFAARYSLRNSPVGGSEYKEPAYEQVIEWEKEEEELNKKEYALIAQIQELRVLLARKSEPDQGL